MCVDYENRSIYDYRRRLLHNFKYKIQKYNYLLYYFNY
jgi:hypothetical protein